MQPQIIFMIILSAASLASIILASKATSDLAKLEKRLQILEMSNNQLNQLLDVHNETNTNLHHGNAQTLTDLYIQLVATNKTLTSLNKKTDLLQRTLENTTQELHNVETEHNKELHKNSRKIARLFNESYHHRKRLGDNHHIINDIRHNASMLTIEIGLVKRNLGNATISINSLWSNRHSVQQSNSYKFQLLNNLTKANQLKVDAVDRGQISLQQTLDSSVSETQNLKTNLSNMNRNVENVSARQMLLFDKNNKTNQELLFLTTRVNKVATDVGNLTRRGELLQKQINQTTQDNILLNRQLSNVNKSAQKQSAVEFNGNQTKTDTSTLQYNVSNNREEFQQLRDHQDYLLNQINNLNAELMNVTELFNNSFNELRRKIESEQKTDKGLSASSDDDIRNYTISLRRRIAIIEEDICSRTGLIYGDECIKMLGYGGPGATYAAASQMCAALGGKVADVSSDDMMEQVRDSINTLRNGQFSSYGQFTSQDVWISSRYENGVIRLANGTVSRITQWLFGYPNNETDRTHMALLFGATGAAYNVQPSNNSPHPLCSFRLDY